MTVYVDKPSWPWKGQLWGHMVADDLTELRAFAKKVGLHPGWIQLPPKTRYPHFDLNVAKFQKALSLGAVLGTKVQVITAAKKCRVEYLEGEGRGGVKTNAP